MDKTFVEKPATGGEESGASSGAIPKVVATEGNKAKTGSKFGAFRTSLASRSASFKLGRKVKTGAGDENKVNPKKLKNQDNKMTKDTSEDSDVVSPAVKDSSVPSVKQSKPSKASSLARKLSIGKYRSSSAKVASSSGQSSETPSPTDGSPKLRKLEVTDDDQHSTASSTSTTTTTTATGRVQGPEAENLSLPPSSGGGDISNQSGTASPGDVTSPPSRVEPQITTSTSHLPDEAESLLGRSATPEDQTRQGVVKVEEETKSNVDSKEIEPVVIHSNKPPKRLAEPQEQTSTLSPKSQFFQRGEEVKNILKSESKGAKPKTFNEKLELHVHRPTKLEGSDENRIFKIKGGDVQQQVTETPIVKPIVWMSQQPSQHKIPFIFSTFPKGPIKEQILSITTPHLQKQQQLSSKVPEKESRDGSESPKRLPNIEEEKEASAKVEDKTRSKTENNSESEEEFGDAETKHELAVGSNVDLKMSRSLDSTLMAQQIGEKREHLYKILVIGELGTGKTSIIKRYVHQFFSQHYRATIGVDFALKVLNWDSNTVIRLQLWDIAGQERFGNMTRVYYKEAVGAFIVFDVTRAATFDAVVKWKQDLDSKVQLPDGSPIPCVLLANKCDQQKEGIVNNAAKMEDYCKEKGFAGWYETSAKENINIEDAAKSLVTKILQNDKLIHHNDSAKDLEKFALDGKNQKDQRNGKTCAC